MEFFFFKILFKIFGPDAVNSNILPRFSETDVITVIITDSKSEG